MKLHVTKKQYSSKKCLVCGWENDLGLKAAFYELENNELVALFSPLEEHQSYPGRMHGGIAAAILDETIGRAIMVADPNTWGVTVELTLQYKKPVPLGQELRVIGRITKDSRRLFEGTGELLLESGDVAVTAQGKYLKMPLEKIAEDFDRDEEWKVLQPEQAPKEIEL